MSSLVVAATTQPQTLFMQRTSNVAVSAVRENPGGPRDLSFTQS